MLVLLGDFLLALMKEVVRFVRPTWQGAVGGLQQTPSKSLNPVNNPQGLGSGSFLLEPSHENPILADILIASFSGPS